MNLIFSFPVNFGEYTKDVDFEADVVMGGIGAYDFWGAKGYQSGPEIDNIDFDTTGLTNEEISFINKYVIESQELEDKIWNTYANQ